MRSSRTIGMLMIALAGNAWGQAATYSLIGGHFAPGIAGDHAARSRIAGFPDNSAACERARKIAIEAADGDAGELRCVAGAADQPLATEQAATVDLSSKFSHPPRYPRQAAVEGRAGRVVVLVKVDAQGLPTGFSIDTSSGSADLDDAALTAARQWLYRPAFHDGQAQAGEIRVPLTFAPN
jgi:TonB family protein